MNSQHSATAHRLRSHPDLFDCTSRQFSTPEGRSEFRELIGRREDDDGLSFYDTTNVLILHKNYNGEFDVDTFMLHPALFVVRVHLFLLQTSYDLPADARSYYEGPVDSNGDQE